MATNFPGSLDNSTSLPYPGATSARNSPSLAGGQDNQNDAIIATQTKVGTGSSTPTLNNILVGTGAGSSAWSLTAPSSALVGISDTQTLTNKTLTSPTISSPTITNATITADVLSGFTSSSTGTVYGVPVTSGVLSTANTINGSAIVAASVGSTALNTNAVQASQIATNAITLGYTQITGNISTSSTSQVQATGLTATVTIPAGGRRVRITHFSNIQTGTNVKKVLVAIWDGTVGSGTQLNAGTNIIQNAGNDQYVIVQAIVTPSAGSKTYNIGWASDPGGSVTMTMDATTTQPAFILVETI